MESDEKVLSEIPQYVVDYAPLVHLYSGEEYWPCDIREHLRHITPELNFTPVQASWQHPRLENLDGLNQWEYGRHVFLTSNDNVEDHPEWLMGKKNIPAAPAPSRHAEPGFSSQPGARKIRGGRSDAPAVLVVVDKGHGIVDAFWFFFYSFNLGNVVVLRFGNHIGDWEHTVVRFHHGKPKAVFARRTATRPSRKLASGQSSIPQQGRTPCMQHPGCTRIYFPGPCYMIKPTKGRYGTRL
jgi:hypothetical protein